MKFIFVFLLLMSSFSLFAKQRAVDLRWDFPQSIVEKVHLYRLEVVQIINGEHNLVLSKMVAENHFNWETERFGFFIMRVFPLTEKGQIIQNAEIEKPLYWEGEIENGKPKPLYLCGAKQQWQWEALPGRSKFLVRLTVPSSKSIPIEKIVRSHSIELESTLFNESQVYRLIILAYDNQGKIDLIRDERLVAKSCADQPLPAWHSIKDYATRISYRPEGQWREQQRDQTVNYSGISWMSFGAEVTQDENKLWSHSADFSYSSLCSTLSFCQDQVALRLKTAYRLNERWLASAAFHYQNLSLLNMLAYDQNSREVEDRAHLFSLQLGASYRFHLGRKQADLSAMISYTPFSYYLSGDVNTSETTSLSGYGVQFVHRLYLSSSWILQGEFQYQSYRGQGTTTISTLNAGPVYQF